MKRILSMMIMIAMATSPIVYAQKGKNKGGGGGGGNQKMNIKMKTDEGQVKMKTNNKNGQIKIDIKEKGGKDHDHDEDHDGWGGHHDNGNHYGEYKNKTIWVFGPGDIYLVSGKPHRERIIIFDQVCVRLTTNIGFMFGLLGDIRIKLDNKKASLKPERYNQIKVEVDLLETDLRLIEIKKKKIKLRLAQLKNENDQGEDD